MPGPSPTWDGTRAPHRRDAPPAGSASPSACATAEHEKEARWAQGKHMLRHAFQELPKPITTHWIKSFVSRLRLIAPTRDVAGRFRNCGESPRAA